MEALFASILERLDRLEKMTGIADKFIPLPCPYCGEKSDSEIRVEPIDNGGWFAAICQRCHASGPHMRNAQDAIWGWNQFVSHRGQFRQNRL